MATGRAPVAIVGVYETEQARRIDRPAISLYLEAVKGALADAGLTKDDIDGISAHWPGPGGNTQFPSAADWAKQLNIEATWASDTYPSGPVALDMAYGAISAGLCNTVLVVSGQVGVVPQPGEAVVAYTRVANEFIETWGASTPLEFALVAQRHMHLFGTTQEQIAEVSATIRNHGHVNPNAVFYGRGPFTVDDILASRIVCSPLHLLDLSTVSEGVAAMIVTNRVHDVAGVPVYVRGTATSHTGTSYVDPPLYEEVGRLGVDTGNRAFARAGLAREDIDVFELYDPTSFEVIRQFEVLGYCEEGEGGKFVSGGRIAIGGSHPTNTDGGLLSHAHIMMGQMTLKLKEAVDQLRGGCGPRQVPGARNALVTAGGGPARFFSVSILSLDPS